MFCLLLFSLVSLSYARPHIDSTTVQTTSGVLQGVAEGKGAAGLKFWTVSCRGNVMRNYSIWQVLEQKLPYMVDAVKEGGLSSRQKNENDAESLETPGKNREKRPRNISFGSLIRSYLHQQ